jgi:superfamily II DNA or RNA helicase
MQSSFDVNLNSIEVISHAISKLKFPFHLKRHQLEAVDAWISNGLRGSIIYSSGTGKTEIAFECARRAADIISSGSSMNILLLVPRFVLIVQYLKRLVNYAIPKEKIGVFFGERKEIKEITISTYQSVIYNPELIRKSKMVIFDDVHLVSDTAKQKDITMQVTKIVTFYCVLLTSGQPI